MSSWYNLQSYAFDRPIQYKNLLIYPVKMENYFEFLILVQSLLFEKNATLEGITKTYLDYLYTKKDEDFALSKFDALLKMCLREKDFMVDYVYESKKAGDITKSYPIFVVYKNEKDLINKKDGEKYTSADLDELRILICEQNAVEIPDETIQKEVRDSMEEARRLKAKINGTIPPSLEDCVVCVMTATGLTTEEVANLSIRKFGQLLSRIDTKLHYQIFLTASLSGFVEFKDKSVLKHWMSGTDVDEKWKDTTISVESMKGKLAFDDLKSK